MTELLPQIQTYDARDGKSLCYRHFPCHSDKMVLLLHGISEDGAYLYPLARFLSSRGLAQVVVPDLRGYGCHPVRRGDVEYVGQLDHDLEDLAAWLERRAAEAGQQRLRLIAGGHSEGGATAIRLAVTPLARRIAAFLLLAPAVHPIAPINRPDAPASDGPLYVLRHRLAALTMLNYAGLRFWNHKVVLRNDKPRDTRHGRETLELSFRLWRSRLPKAKYERYLAAMTQPTLVMVGLRDEVFVPSKFGPMFAEFNAADVRLVQGADHEGIVTNERAFREVERWIGEL